MLRVNHGRAGCERGAVAVEFALIMPVLLLILFGTIEFGRVYSEWQVFNGAAREGARCAAVQATEFNHCDVATSIRDASQSYASDLAPESSWSITPAGGCTDATHGQDVTVSWPQPLKIDVPFWDNVTVTPTISATFRCE
jgi:Flp pilus assembly protein TadG